MDSRVLGGALETRMTALGVPVVVRSHGDHAEQLDRAVARVWQDCLFDHGANQSNPVVVDAMLDDDPERVRKAATRGVVAATDLERVLDWLSPAITGCVIRRNAGHLLMLHACGLADHRTGATVALVAPSGTGKTTAALTLGKRWGYISDETVGIGPHGRVVAYPKPLSILDSPTATYKRQRPASELGLMPAPPSPRIAAIVLLNRSAENQDASCVVIPTVSALAALAPHISFMSRLQRPLHHVASVLRDSHHLRSVAYAEAAQLHELLDAIVTDY